MLRQDKDRGEGGSQQGQQEAECLEGEALESRDVLDDHLDLKGTAVWNGGT